MSDTPKYYGIFHVDGLGWFSFDNHQLFFTDSLAVAKIQLDILGRNDKWVVKPIKRAGG